MAVKPDNLAYILFQSSCVSDHEQIYYPFLLSLVHNIGGTILSAGRSYLI